MTRWLLFCLIALAHVKNTCLAQKYNRPEFRGVWIATVTNIDWPDTDFKGSESQKASFIRLLDMHKKNGINAVIVQIRPASDALYFSTIEPWSKWFTGTQAQPPQPWYDPLEFMITESHKRGMEFHAWMNPYRAIFNLNNSKTSPTHITKIHPEWFIRYGEKLYFDPSNEEARRYIAFIVKDVVNRYDVDAIHFDDYFYPYKVNQLEFNDQASYLAKGKGMKKEDWRRSNVDSIIALVSRIIRQNKPGCQFGISPFGVWRNADRDPVHGSKTRAGVTNYDDLFADILLWLKNDWIDYVAPQVYWETTSKNVPFNTVVDWWNEHTYGKNCYIGIGLYRAGSNTTWRNKEELPRQIKKIRSLPNVQGMSFYSSKTLENNVNGWADSLRQNYFSEPAKVPAVRR